MIIRLQPLPDEMDVGYLGRLLQMNGVGSERAFVELARDYGNQAGEYSMADLLTDVAGVSLQNFVMQHSTLPLRRAITSHRPDVEHGFLKGKYLLSSFCRHIAQQGAQYCLECVQADQAFHGFSYWRRTHQLPGVTWCAKHRTNLWRASGREPFLMSPAKSGNSAVQLQDDWIEQAKANPFIDRAMEICSGLIDRTTPLSVRLVSRLLKRRAAEKGLQSSQYKNGRKPLLSDLVIERFGREWLSTVIPSFADKQHGELLHQLDGVLYLANSASSVIAYVLAASVLYDSADEALNALVGAESASFPVRLVKRLPHDQLVRDAYIAGKGSYSETAAIIGHNVTSVTLRLKSLGLPNLAGRHAEGVSSALIAFLRDGDSLADSASRAGIPISLLESVMRVVATPFGKVLCDVISSPPDQKSAFNDECSVASTRPPSIEPLLH